MIKANCPICNSRREFKHIKNDEYKCTSCNSILHKCKNQKCINMTKLGFFCDKCVGHGLKNGGALLMAVPIFLLAGVKKFIK